jgi:hypothetical protein
MEDVNQEKKKVPPMSEPERSTPIKVTISRIFILNLNQLFETSTLHHVLDFSLLKS